LPRELRTRAGKCQLPASAFAVCNLTFTTANLDANLGAVSGCIAVPGGAAICNVGP